MNDDTAQQIQDIYETLPQDIKDVISSEGTAKKLEAISTQHNLHIDQAGSLSDLTTMVMLGVTPAGEFVSDIKKELEISEPEAIAIANDVNEQILRDIKASLMKLDAENNTDDTSEPTTPATEDYSTLNAKDILHEIENPVQVPPPAAPAAQIVVTPASTTIAPTPAIPQPLVEGTGINLIENHPAAQPSLIEQKLSQTVRAPEPQKIDLVPKPVSKLPPLTNKPSGGSTGADAYREPIV